MPSMAWCTPALLNDQARAGVMGGSVGWDQLLSAQAWMPENQTGSDEAFSAKTDKATWYVSKARAAPA